MKTQFKGTILKTLASNESITIPASEVWKVEVAGGYTTEIKGKELTVNSDSHIGFTIAGTTIKANSSGAVIFGIIFTEVL